MKNKFLLIFGLLPTLLFAQEKYTIKGVITDLNPAGKVFLQYFDGDETKLDSTNIKNGTFTFHGIVNEPSEAYVIYSENGLPLDQLSSPDFRVLYLSSGVIKLAGTTLKESKLSGNNINNDFAKYELAGSQFKSGELAIMNDYAEASEEKKEDEDFLLSLQNRYEKLVEVQNKVDMDFIKNNPSSLIALNIIDEKLDASNGKEMKVLFDALKSNLKDSKKGKGVQEKISALTRLAIGELAPDFSMMDVDGKEVALSSLRGQYVLLDFWASWCTPCREESPYLVAAYNTFKDKGFTVYGVSLDRPGKKSDWLEAIEQDGLGQWTNVSDLLFWKSPVVKLYSIRGIPQNFLLDKEGRIIGSNLRGSALEAKLAEVLK